MAMPNLDPNFEWSWQGVLKKAAQSGMEGYNPAASNAANQMQGYAPTPEPSVVDAGSQGGAVERGMPGEIAQQNAAQEAQRAEQIRALEEQIAEIQARIAQNQAKLKNFTGSTNQIAALEARKINSQDPTMIWRWQKQREDTANANANIGITDAQKFENKANMLIQQRASTSTPGIEQQIRNIESAIVEGQNFGADVTGLFKKKEELEAKIDGSGEASGEFKSGTKSENLKANVTDFLNQKHSSSEIKKFIDEHEDLGNNEKIKLNMAYNDRKRIEKNEADEAAFFDWAKQFGLKKGSDPEFEKSLRKAYKKRGK